jgi:hypothetical protein
VECLTTFKASLAMKNSELSRWGKVYFGQNRCHVAMLLASKTIIICKTVVVFNLTLHLASGVDDRRVDRLFN